MDNTTAARCTYLVAVPGMNFHRTRQCKHAATKDGFCTLHHPDTVKAKREAALAKSRTESEARMAAADARQTMLRIGSLVMSRVKTHSDGCSCDLCALVRDAR